MEYTDKAHLLAGNHAYAVKIIVKNGLSQYYLDEILFWEFPGCHTLYQKDYWVQDNHQSSGV